MSGEDLPPLTATFPQEDERPGFRRERSERQETPRDRNRQAALQYGPRGSALFLSPTPSQGVTASGLPKGTRRFDLSWLLSRAVLGETAPREALIEVIWRVGHSKALKPFDEQTRDVAIVAVTEKLLGYGLLGLGLAVHFDVRRAPAFLSWLVRALRNAATDELRRKRPATVSDVTVIADEDGEEREHALSGKAERHDAEGHPIIPGAALSEPARDLAVKQRLAIALAAVDEREREILLAIADGETPEEIGGRLGIKASRVRGIVSEARRKAREALSNVS
jgi:RNA polymerase sigma factor (sigma-70 family)